MSSPPRLARLATQELARARRVPPSPTAADEARAIEAIAEALDREAAAARRRTRAIGGALAAVASIAAAVAVFELRPPRGEPTKTEIATTKMVTAQGHSLAGSVVLLRRGREVSVDEGSGLGAGDRIVAPAEGRASITLSTGTHMVVESGADFAITELGSEQRFMLRAGAVRAYVAKLGSGQRFIVGTGDAEVEVRGTSFRVSVVAPSPSCGGGTSTRVSVTEGTVVVRAGGVEERVPAGGEWPVGCAPRAEAASPSSPPGYATAARAPEIDAPVAPRPTTAVATPATSTSTTMTTTSPKTSQNRVEVAPDGQPRAGTAADPGAGPSARSTEIAEQNRLFAEASSARRRGAVTEAIAGYEAFLARYPSSQLAESAMVERMRMLGATRPAAAAGAAREYLARYPGGFARQEATALAAGRP